MMESTNPVNDPLYRRIRFFPTVTDGKVNIKEFLDAATDLVTVVDHLGRVFSPVKNDMQGNIDKVKNGYNCNDETCLLNEIKTEIESGSPKIAEGVLWLNRTILFFEIMFQEVIKCLRSNNINVSMKKIYTVAYEGSVKQYHNWVTQQLFLMICRLSPGLPQCLNSLEADNMTDMEIFLSNYVQSLTPVRCAIDNAFKVNNMFS